MKKSKILLAAGLMLCLIVMLSGCALNESYNGSSDVKSSEKQSKESGR